MGISLRQKSVLSPMDNCTVILHDLPWESSPGMTRVRPRGSLRLLKLTLIELVYSVRGSGFQEHLGILFRE